MRTRTIKALVGRRRVWTRDKAKGRVWYHFRDGRKEEVVRMWYPWGCNAQVETTERYFTCDQRTKVEVEG
jgi:hypothetical protein